MLIEVNWYSIFYLLSVVDNISLLLAWIGGISCVLLIISLIIWYVADRERSDEEQWAKRAKTVLKWTVPLMFISFFGVVFLPSKSQCLMIIAGGTAFNFLGSDSSAKAIPSDITKYLHLSLQKEIKNLDSETREELGLLTPKEKFVNSLKDLTKEEILRRIDTAKLSE